MTRGLIAASLNQLWTPLVVSLSALFFAVKLGLFSDSAVYFIALLIVALPLIGFVLVIPVNYWITQSWRATLLIAVFSAIPTFVFAYEQFTHARLKYAVDMLFIETFLLPAIMLVLNRAGWLD